MATSRLSLFTARAGQSRPLLFLGGSAFWAGAGNAQSFDRLLAARAQHDVGSRLHPLRPPSVVMAGRHDGQAKPAHVNALAQKLSNSVLWTFEGGHGCAFAPPQTHATTLCALG